MTRPTVRRACSAAGSSKAPWRQAIRCGDHLPPPWRPAHCVDVRTPFFHLYPGRGQVKKNRTAIARELDQATLNKAYARWAPIYDVVFGAVFDRGRHAAIVAA